MKGKVASQRAHGRSLYGIVLALSFIVVLPGGCKEKAPGEPSGKTATKDSAAKVFTVYTTFYPVTYFAERIGGDRVKVVCPCPADADPARWMPDDDTLQRYQAADLIVINGADFEDWVSKVTLPASRTVDTARPLRDEFIMLADTVTHSHGPGGAHTHSGIDGHTWLDPLNAKKQAFEIKEALARLLPDHQKVFEDGYAALARDLDALDSRFKALSPEIQDEFLLCSHPAYNYLGRRYGWKTKYYLLDPEAMPEELTLREIKTFLEGQPAKYMLWEALPTEEIARRFKEDLGLQAVLFSPCESLDAEELAAGKTFVSVMNENIDRLASIAGSH